MMPAPTPQEIEKLKAQFPNNTRGLARAVAERLFLADERPTRNRVYTLIQRGSMSTIDKGLKDFEGALRRMYHANIHVPDVPEALVPPFQAGVKGLWDAAVEQATRSFDDERKAFEAQLLDAKSMADSAKQKEQAATAAMEQTRKELTATADALGATRTERDTLAENLKANEAVRDRLSGDVAQLQQAAVLARQEHDAAMAELTEERRRDREALEGQLSFATKQIDEAREKAKALSADLDRERKRNERIEREAREDANIRRIAHDDLQRRLDDALSEVTRTRHALDSAHAERAKALEQSADATARGMVQAERLNGELRAALEARQAAEASISAARLLLRRFQERIKDGKRPVTPKDPLFKEISGLLGVSEQDSD